MKTKQKQKLSDREIWIGKELNRGVFNVGYIFAALHGNSHVITVPKGGWPANFLNAGDVVVISVKKEKVPTEEFLGRFVACWFTLNGKERVALGTYLESDSVPKRGRGRQLILKPKNKNSPDLLVPLKDIVEIRECKFIIAQANINADMEPASEVLA